MEGDDDSAASPAGAPMLDGDVMQALSNGNLPEQLADATSALQQQLLTITQEMNRLKSEIYSEQGGLAEKLSELTQQASALDDSARKARNGDAGDLVGSRSGDSNGSADPRNRASSFKSDVAAVRARIAATEANRAKRADEPLTSGRPVPRGSTGRRVEFAPGTRDPLPMRDRYGRPQAPPQPGWTPYIVGFCLLCIGPMRPLLWEAVTTLWSTIFASSRSDEELAWYDQ